MANGLPTPTIPTIPKLPVKKPTINYPYAQPGQALPLAPGAVQQPTLAGAGQVFDPTTSQQVVQQAQTKALAGTTPATADLVSRQTQQLLQKPSMGRDVEAEKKLALDRLSRKQASDFEAMRQATGGTANLGFNVEELMGAQMQQRQERTDVERQLEIDEQNRKQQEMLSALTAGRETAGMEQAFQTGDIGNLIDAAGGALGFAELASKQDVLLSEQDFEASEAELTRQFQEAMQKGDYAQANQMAISLNKMESIREQKQSEYNIAEATAYADLDLAKMMQENEYTTAREILDRDHEVAMQNNDRIGQELILDKQHEIELKMITQRYDDDQKRAILEVERQKAAETRDETREKAILRYMADIDIEASELTQTHEETQADLDRKLQAALQENDFANADVLNEKKYTHEMAMWKETETIERLKLALEQQGLDSVIIQQTYDNIQEAVEKGQAAPEDAIAYLQRQSRKGSN